MKGEYKKAVSSYERARLRARKKWIKEYAGARLVECFGETRQFARAVKTYIDLCRSGSSLLRWVKLPSAMPKGSPDNDVVLKDIEKALSASPDAPYADKLRELRLSIRLIQGNPSDILPEIEAQLGSPNPEHQAKMRLKHIELLLAVGKFDEAKKSLDVARDGLGEKYKPLDAQYEPELLFFEGRYLHAKKDCLHAALLFMRVPIHFRRKKALAAKALYWAAKSMYDSQAVPLSEAVAPLREAIEKYPGTEGATEAKKMLDRLTADSVGS